MPIWICHRKTGEIPIKFRGTMSRSTSQFVLVNCSFDMILNTKHKLLSMNTES